MRRSAEDVTAWCSRSEPATWSGSRPHCGARATTRWCFTAAWAPRLGVDRAEPAGQYRAVLPDRQPLSPGVQVIGSGSCLHLLTGTSWYQLDVGDIPGMIWHQNQAPGYR